MIVSLGVEVRTVETFSVRFSQEWRWKEKTDEHSRENSEIDAIQRIPRADYSTEEASVSEGSPGQREIPVSTGNSSSSESSSIQRNVRKRPRLTYTW